MLTTIVGIGCFISGGLLGATIMAILAVAKHFDQVSDVLEGSVAKFSRTLF